MAIITPTSIQNQDCNNKLFYVRFATASVAASGTSDTIKLIINSSVGMIKQISAISNSLDISVKAYDDSAVAAANLISDTNIVGTSAPVQSSVTDINAAYSITDNTIYIVIVNNDTSNATGTMTITVTFFEE